MLETKFAEEIPFDPIVIPAEAGIQKFWILLIPGRASFSLRLIRPAAESPACPE